MRLRFKRYFSYHQVMLMIMLWIFIENMQTSAKTIELADLGEKKLHNATNKSS